MFAALGVDAGHQFDLVQLKGQRQAPGGIWAELERAVLMLCGINVLQRKDAVNY